MQEKKGKKKSTKATASSAVTRAVAPGKILFGMNGTKVDHITCKKKFAKLKIHLFETNFTINCYHIFNEAGVEEKLPGGG